MVSCAIFCGSARGAGANGLRCKDNSRTAAIIPYCAPGNKRICKLGGPCSPLAGKNLPAVVQIYNYSDDCELNLVEIHGIIDMSFARFVKTLDGGERL